MSLGKRSHPLSRQDASSLKNRGRAEGRIKVCLGDGESERKSDRAIKEVRRIYSNPMEGLFLLSQAQRPNPKSLL